jgi:hypothetical protein
MREVGGAHQVGQVCSALADEVLALQGGEVRAGTRPVVREDFCLELKRVVLERSKRARGEPVQQVRDTIALRDAGLLVELRRRLVAERRYWILPLPRLNGRRRRWRRGRRRWRRSGRRRWRGLGRGHVVVARRAGDRSGEQRGYHAGRSGVMRPARAALHFRRPSSNFRTRASSSSLRFARPNDSYSSLSPMRAILCHAGGARGVTSLHRQGLQSRQRIRRDRGSTILGGLGRD